VNNFFYKKNDPFKTDPAVKQLKNSDLSVLAFSKKINIPARTPQDWVKYENHILSAEKNAKKNGKSNKPILDKIVENNILEWIFKY